MTRRRLRRVVVKVGSGLIADPVEGPDPARIEPLAADVAAVMASGVEVVLVSSGAIAAGMARLGLGGKPRSIPEKQAAAAVGQSALMWHYEQAFRAHGIQVGQVLLTAQDISDRARYLNARNTLLALLGFDVLPIINENDTVAVEEIKVGDNDNLAALVASLIDADLLVLLTDVDGLYTGDPRRDPTARRIETRGGRHATRSEARRGRRRAGGGRAAWRRSSRRRRRRWPPGSRWSSPSGRRARRAAGRAEGRGRGDLLRAAHRPAGGAQALDRLRGAAAGRGSRLTPARAGPLERGKSLLPSGVLTVSGRVRGRRGRGGGATRTGASSPGAS